MMIPTSSQRDDELARILSTFAASAAFFREACTHVRVAFFLVLAIACQLVQVVCTLCLATLTAIIALATSFYALVSLLRLGMQLLFVWAQSQGRAS